MSDRSIETLGDSTEYKTLPRGLKHSNKELLLPLLPMIFYAIPAIWIAAQIPPESYPSWLDQTMFILPSLIVILAVISVSRGVDWFPKSGEWEPNEENKPELDLGQVDFDEEKSINSLRLEYQELCEEARYRDRLLLQTGYFALATMGLLGGVFTAVPPSTQPFIAMLASLIMMAFAIAVNSYKDSRDANWDRIGRMEGSIPEFQGVLTTFHSMRHMDRRMLNKISLSSYLYLITVFMTIITVIVYIATIMGWRISA